jgi:capsular exopolysaccharide synthesis family protein
VNIQEHGDLKLGKIFNALEKYLKESSDAPDVEPLTDEDCEALLQYNQLTQTLNINSQHVIKESSTVRRLLVNKLILPDGKITAKGKKKYEELIYQRRVDMAGKPGSDGKDSILGASNGQADPLRATDWDVLMCHDPRTGHLLNYDPETGQLDSASLATLDQAGIIQRLLAHELITPEGRLTLKGFQECRRIKNEQPEAPPADTLGPTSKDGLRSFLEDFNDIEERGKTPLQEAFSAQKPFVWKSETDGTDRNDQGEESIIALRSRPMGTSPLDPNLVSLLAPQSFMAERFKILRTNLLYPVSGGTPRSILITSLNPGDGKSFVAANLAVSVAMNLNRHVLLMDCDLRKPTIHNQFGFGECPGLSEYLERDLPLSSFLLQTKIDRLTILPGGTPPLNPSELLSSNRMSDLMQEVTNRYKDRLIIIDSPPPTLTSETGVLAKMAEGIILVVRHLKTSRDDLNSLVKQVGKEKIVGSVLNYFDAPSVRMKGYRYYRKYGDEVRS